MQIAYEAGVIVELRGYSFGEFPYSQDLLDLLNDRRITKVFCDRSGNDRRALQLDSDRTDVECIEDKANEAWGPSSPPGARGLVNIAAQALRVDVTKESEGLWYFVDVDNGWRPVPHNLGDIPEASLDYAAADAWLTREAALALDFH